ncbi:MAG: hypothetical protein U1E62_20545 [Alsobacter sp.]
MRRLFVVVVALVLAIAAGAIFLAVAGLAVPETRELAADISLGQVLLTMAGIAHGAPPDQVWSVVALTFWILALFVLVLPPVLAGLVGEVAGARSFVFYGGLSGALAAGIAWLGHPAATPPDAADTKVLLLVFLTGAVAGLVYWALAGRTAGGGAAQA